MPKDLIAAGQDHVVAILDRTYGGREKEVVRTSGTDGSVAYTTDVSIKGSLVVNGRPITGGGSGGSMVNEVLGRPLKLSFAPSGDTCLFINGQLQRITDYIVNPDDSVTWQCHDFTIAPTDLVEAVYQI